MASTQAPQYEEKNDSGSLEKAGTNDYVVHADSRHHFDAADLDRVQRRLKQRHVQMIAVSHSSLPPLFIILRLMLSSPVRLLVLLELVFSWVLEVLCEVLVLWAHS